MDHSGHSGHHDMPDLDLDFGSDNDEFGTPPCKMNMLFTWNSEDLCIVFEWWHIRTGFGFFVSLIAIVLLSMGYEYARNLVANLEADLESSSSSTASRRDQKVQRRIKITKGLIYAVQVFYSFFLMLVFMTYNGWVMLAVTAGAFLGHVLWSTPLSKSKGMSCH
ncbi:Ctr copper transporter family-domain-containing protein [Lipomyces japonicus]|uniref:Ctr copper transporter family-domain-containing protein n=1 Tax=Lipomyces japonicus TaxID=56871 RepID=UPI0034CE91D9